MPRKRASALGMITASFTVACGPLVALDADGEPPVPAPNTIDECRLDDTPFDPHAGTVLQGLDADDGWCVRIEREALAARRGTEWRALSLRVRGPGFELGEDDDDALAYGNTHHNCADTVRTPVTESLSVTIDGASVDANVCFSDRPADWALVVEVDGASHVLAPWPAAR